jgi:asparagine synthase (glutamine-hydrolysing)
MCGIFGLLNNDTYSYELINNEFTKGSKRGPEFSSVTIHNNFFLGFHRLAINGLNVKSNQPFNINNITLVCNGEIYNYKELAHHNNISLTTDSDCEIILHLYLLYGIEYTLNLLDGVFAFILIDKNNDAIYIARDPYGVRPLYYFYENNSIGFASELQSIYKFPKDKKNIQNFLPSHYMVINNTKNNEKILIYNFSYNSFPFKTIDYSLDYNLYKDIVNNLTNAVKKRVMGTTERPIGCLLSGGLDSSLIAALVSKFYNNTNNNQKLKTFSIGLEGSEDLKYAKIVAKHLNSDHHEIIVEIDDFFNAIPEVIKNISSFDTTTVRASVGNYLIGKYIKKNSDCKVIFNGDGSDELMGGYLYLKKAPNAYEFDKECKRLLIDIHMFDVLRSDRCISSHGLEPRTPFLDRGWTEFYLSINKDLRYNSTIENCEKYLIRKAFSEVCPDLLPSEILWRTKEAFSDGVSSLQKSWFQIIQEKVEKLSKLDYELTNIQLVYQKMKTYKNIPTTKEQAYYRYLYNKDYIGTDHLIDYFWMPKYVDAKDASARSLKCYQENNSNNSNNSNNIEDNSNVI